jgi:hypothetical protein
MSAASEDELSPTFTIIGMRRMIWSCSGSQLTEPPPDAHLAVL